MGAPAKAITQKRNKKKTNIITDFLSEATLQEADRIFHSKLIEARRGIRQRTETVYE